MATWDENIAKGLKSGYFDCASETELDRLYNAIDMSNYFEGLVGDGVFANIGDELKITPGTSGLSVTMGTGRAMLKCRWMRATAPVTLELPAASSLVATSYYIAIELNTSAGVRQMQPVVVQGSEPPANNAENGLYYLTLAKVNIPANATSVRGNDIEDLRASRTCGYVTSLAAKTSLTHYRNHYQIDADGTSFEIGIANYIYSTDVLFVHLNGLKLVEDVDFTISGSKIITTHTLKAGGILDFEAIKGAES